MIPFVDLKTQFARIEADVRRRLDAVLTHQQFIMGPEVGQFETVLAERAGVAHAVGVSSGTDALLVPLMAWGIGAGDAVFVPAFTFTATPEVVLMTGATPVFVDVEEGTFNIDPVSLRAAVERVVRDGVLRPRCVMAVDLFGLPADYAALRPLCDEFQMRLLADAAQSFGAALNHVPVGALADATATSFFPAKPLGAYGDAGAVICDDDELAHTARSIRAHGKGDAKYEIVRVGLNARLDTMQAAILLAKLAVFDEELQAREQLASQYDAALAGSVEIPARVAGARSAWAQYTLKLDDRDGVAARLREAGVPSAIYYPKPMHWQTAYREYAGTGNGFPVAESLCARVLSLPMHPYMDDATVRHVCESVRAAVAG